MGGIAHVRDHPRQGASGGRSDGAGPVAAGTGTPTTFVAGGIYTLTSRESARSAAPSSATLRNVPLATALASRGGNPAWLKRKKAPRGRSRNFMAHPPKSGEDSGLRMR